MKRILPLVLLLACGDPADGDVGTLTLLVEPEDAILEGVPAGDSGTAMRDGWSATFDTYYTALGAIEVRLSADPSVTASAPAIHVVDLRTLDAAGLPLWTLEGLEAGRYDLFYEHGLASMEAPSTVDPGDLRTMVDNEWSYWIAGTLEKSDGQACPPTGQARPPAGATPNGNTNARGDACYDQPVVTFDWGVRVEARFGPCAIDDSPGFAMPAGGSQTVALSIHGDHLFFNGFPEGAETGVTRLAQWIADADLDLDGEVVRAELEALAPADLAAIDERYALGGAPIVIRTMWDYVVAQLHTQAHYQGEGECPVAAR